MSTLNSKSKAVTAGVIRGLISVAAVGLTLVPLFLSLTASPLVT